MLSDSLKRIDRVIGGLGRVLPICPADIHVYVAVYISIRAIINGPNRLRLQYMTGYKRAEPFACLIYIYINA